MRKALYHLAWLACLLCILAPAQSYWQSRDSNYNQNVTAGASCTPGTNASNFLARTSGLDATHTAAYCVLINGLDTDSLFTSFDALYIYATQDSTTAALNLISSTFNSSVSAGVSFSVDLGFTGNGTSGIIDTTFNPAVASSPKFTQNSAHLSLWNLTNQAEASVSMGANIAINTLAQKYIDNNCYFRVNDASSGFSISDPRGHILGNRSSSTGREGYQNASTTLNGGASVSYGSTASLTPQNTNIVMLSDGLGSSFSTFQLAMASIGASLSSGQVTLFYNRLRTYMTTVGVP